MIKAVFIDIDGTLKHRNKNLSERTKETIKRVCETGILVVLCSGRPRKHTEEVSRACSASKYIITSGGGSIHDYERDESLYINKMDKEAIIKLYELAKAKDVKFMMNVGEGRVANKVDHPEREKKLEEDIRAFVYQNDVVQCTIVDDDFNKIKNLMPQIEAIENVEIKNRHKGLLDAAFKEDRSVFCDVANIESGKGNAVKKLLEMLNIRKEEAVAIGDYINDLSMFEQVGYKVAVGNAVERVKEKADEITLPADEDGVAVFLEKVLKNESGRRL